jgi:hypothetical protein
MFGLPFALAAALTLKPVAAAGDVEKTPTPEQAARDLKALTEQLKTLNEQLKALPELRRDVSVLTEKMQGINRELDLSAQAHNRAGQDVLELRAQVKQLRDELDRARAFAGKIEEEVRRQAARCDGLTDQLAQANKKLAETSRQAARMTEPAGSIRLYNTDFRPVEIRVDGRVHVVQPNAEVVLDAQPVGPHEYEVFALGVRHNFTLAADRPMEIEVYNLARGPVRTPPRPR